MMILLDLDPTLLKQEPQEGWIYGELRRVFAAAVTVAHTAKARGLLIVRGGSYTPAGVHYGPARAWSSPLAVHSPADLR